MCAGSFFLNCKIVQKAAVERKLNVWVYVTKQRILFRFKYTRMIKIVGHKTKILTYIVDEFKLLIFI